MNSVIQILMHNYESIKYDYKRQRNSAASKSEHSWNQSLTSVQ